MFWCRNSQLLASIYPWFHMHVSREPYIAKIRDYLLRLVGYILHLAAKRYLVPGITYRADCSWYGLPTTLRVLLRHLFHQDDNVYTCYVLSCTSTHIIAQDTYD